MTMMAAYNVAVHINREEVSVLCLTANKYKMENALDVHQVTI